MWGARVGIAVALMTLAASLHVLLHLALDRYDCACVCAVRVRVRVRVRVYGMCACVWYVCLGRCARVYIYIYEYVYAHMYINMYIVYVYVSYVSTLLQTLFRAA